MRAISDESELLRVDGIPHGTEASQPDSSIGRAERVRMHVACVDAVDIAFTHWSLTDPSPRISRRIRIPLASLDSQKTYLESPRSRRCSPQSLLSNIVPRFFLDADSALTSLLPSYASVVNQTNNV